MRLAILLLGAALGAWAQLSSVEGKVVNAANGQPVSKATVMLRGAANATFNTSTDEKGRYAFGGIEPGSYTLSAERAGFVTAAYGAKRPEQPGKVLVLAPSGKAAGVDVSLLPGGAISGRVVYADGEPAFGASLTLMRVKYIDGRKQLADAVAGILVQSRTLMPTANDLGEFHISSLEPGHYYLRADASYASPGSRMNMADVRIAGQVTAAVLTYYRSAADARTAEPIVVKSGRATPDVLITLAEMPIGTVRGRLDNAGAAAGNTVNVMLFGQSGQSFVLRLNPKTGELEFQGAVPPGRYTAAALVGAGNAPQNPARVRYDLIPVDVTGGAVTVWLHPAVALAGIVRAEEGGARPDMRLDMRQIRIILRPAAFLQGMPAFMQPVQPLAADGNFAFPDVSADRYEVRLSGLPEGVYVQSMRAGDADALENGLDLTQAASGRLEIVLSGKAGSVQGTVTGPDGKPVDGATVALAPVKGREYRTAISDENGRFTVKAAPPGEYRAFAWEAVEDNAWTDPEFLKPVLAKAMTVTVREGSVARVELQPIPVQ